MLLELPSYYHPDDAGKLYDPRMEQIVPAGLKARKQIPVVDRMSAKRWTAMVAIDPEVCFTLKGQALPVEGAIGDVQRACEMVYRRPDLFDEIFFTMDQHFRLSIFFRWWWINSNGEHPGDYTEITAEDVANGTWRPLIMEEWSQYYVTKLQKITIWPEHACVGTEGARLVPAFEEMIWWHAYARNTLPIPMLKGDVLQTESFGVFQPDVRVPGHPRGGLMVEALNLLGRYQRTYWWGEALDFCVISSLLQHITYYEGRPDVLRRMFLLLDCTSPVFANRVDANQASLAELKTAGVTTITADEVLAIAA